MEQIASPGESAPISARSPLYLYLGVSRAIGADTAGLFHSVKEILKERLNVETVEVKLSKLFTGLLEEPLRDDAFGRYVQLMDLGDELRSRDLSLIAQLGVREIKRIKDEYQAASGSSTTGVRLAFFIDSLMHRAEADLFREVYGDDFYLIAMSSSAEDRKKRLVDRLQAKDLDRPMSAGREDISAQVAIFRSNRDNQDRWNRQVNALMMRDEGSGKWREELANLGYMAKVARKKAQVNVQDTFIGADLFLEWGTEGHSRETLQRFIFAIFGANNLTPTLDELGMAHAFVSRRASDSLARRVGAAICTPNGDVLATGSNEVPSPGGGQYYASYAFGTIEIGDLRQDPVRDREFKFVDQISEEMIGVDPNDRIKLEILSDLLDNVDFTISAQSEAAQKAGVSSSGLDVVLRELADRDARILDVIEYTRSVHAEMHALLTCSRLGISVKGAILFTTTFPCHECARHIVAAGIQRVVYLEPYPKSRVAVLHSDAIEIAKLTGPSSDPFPGRARVKFEPYRGISPDRQPHLFSWLQRKISISEGWENAGRAIEWAPHEDAQLRTTIKLSPIAKLARESSRQSCEEDISLEVGNLIENLASDVP